MRILRTYKKQYGGTITSIYRGSFQEALLSLGLTWKDFLPGPPEQTIIYRPRLELALENLNNLGDRDSIGGTIYSSPRLRDYLEIILTESHDEEIRLEWES